VAALVGTAAYLMGRQLQSLQQDLGQVGRDIVRLRAEADGFRVQTLTREEFAGQRAQIFESIGRVEKELAAATERLNVIAAGLRTELSNVEQRLIESMKTDRATHAKDLDTVKQQLGGVNESTAALRATLDQSERRIQELGAKVSELAAIPRLAAPQPDSAPATSAELAAEKELREHLARLKDPESTERYKAVIELGRLKGESVITALEAAVTDSESFVRDAVVRQLRKLGSPTSIPVVLKCLRDEDYFVRASSRDTLKALTGADVSFDPGASPPERDARVKEWEAWWAANRDKFAKPK
jgi:hypothetical protein